MAEDIEHKFNLHFSQYPKRTYPKGHILVFADENPKSIFYITSGRVRKYDISYRGDEVIVNIFKPPSLFPISWALNHTENAFYYKAETPVTIHLVPPEDVYRYLVANPDVCIDVLQRVYRGLEGVYGRMVHLMAGSAQSRLAYELIIECRRFGSAHEDGSFVIAATESDIAARSGLSRETVSREIHKLKLKGWLSVVNRRITVANLVELEKSIGPPPDAVTIATQSP